MEDKNMMLMILLVVSIIEVVLMYLILTTLAISVKDLFMEKIVKRFFPKYYYYDWENKRLEDKGLR